MRLLATLLLSFLISVAFGQHDHRNCGTMEALEQQLQQDPSMRDRMEAIERHTERYQSGDNVQFRAVITIPVVFHIVHNGQAVGTGENVSDAIVLAQLDQMNQDFRKLNSDAGLVPSIFQGVHADTEIQFCLAQRTPSGTATNGINRVNGGQTSWTVNQINSSLKPSTIWDRNQYLNVWSVRFGGGDAGLLGYAQFPGGTASTDGVVVLFSSMGSVANPYPGGGNYARGRTLTHEVGHWLNLRHIWGDATCGNDFVADTPVHNTSNGGCPTYPHYSTCSGSPIEMTMNYMDYTYDACMYMFTAGQSTRMNAVLASGGARASLTSSLGCSAPGGGGTTCGTPSGLNATNVTSTAATLNWGAVSGATAYNVRARQVGTTTWASGTVSGTSVNFTGLTAGTNYEFQVQAVCGSTSGNYSGSATFTTPGGGCSDAYEPNNSRSSSLPLTPVNQNLSAQIATSSDRDWYRFANTSTTRNIRVDLTNLPADYDMELYQNGSRRRISQNGGTTSEVMIWNTTTVASNWYVHVYGYNGAFSNTQCYTLRISLSSSAFRTDGSTDGEVTEFEIPIEVLQSGFTMFPNPATDQLSLDVDLQADRAVRVTVGDITGKTHILRSFDLQKGDSRITLDVSRLPAGTFFVRVENGEVVGVQKLVIVR
ncbi:MAG: fibronectin type III domain-containing protein [Saprospiraceae bacterium]|nr:fibronectin type III domain-containing protein [Saprospiraceae bacterium]